MLRYTWMVLAGCAVAAGLALLPPACGSAQQTGATSAGGGGTGGGAAGSAASSSSEAGAGAGGCDCANHSEECIDYYQFDPMFCGGHVDPNRDCRQYWEISDSTCTGIPNGLHTWNRGLSPDGCECTITVRPDMPKQILWPDCDDSVACRGLPFRLIHQDDPDLDPSCAYQCTGQIENDLDGSGSASCSGPNGESCTLMFTYDIPL